MPINWYALPPPEVALHLRSFPAPYNKPPGIHIMVKPSPSIRQSRYTAWPHGVVNGSIIIDMAERLSYTQEPSDWALSLWLQDHYITPFRQIDRQDGLIVQSPEEIGFLVLAHSKYNELWPMPNGLPPQALWVPGLEPITSPKEARVRIPVLPKNYCQTRFDVSKMYRPWVTRQGTFLGKFKDANGWERKLWEAPEIMRQGKEQEGNAQPEGAKAVRDDGEVGIPMRHKTMVRNDEAFPSEPSLPYSPCPESPTSNNNDSKNADTKMDDIGEWTVEEDERTSIDSALKEPVMLSDDSNVQELLRSQTSTSLPDSNAETEIMRQVEDDGEEEATSGMCEQRTAWPGEWDFLLKKASDD